MMPSTLRFGGCGLLPPPAAQTIPLTTTVAYSVTTDAPWLTAAPNPDGSLRVAASCQGVPATRQEGSC